VRPVPPPPAVARSVPSSGAEGYEGDGRVGDRGRREGGVEGRGGEGGGGKGDAVAEVSGASRT
jgi:hypothetical protein